MNTAFPARLTALTLALALCACAQTPTPTPTAPPAPPTATTTTAPTATPAPTATALPTATPTPTPAPRFEQMTTGTCCVQPFYAPDSKRILFLDKPTANAETGLYAVPVDQPLATPTLAYKQLGPFSPDMSMVIGLEGGQTRVERLADGVKFTIPSGGRRVTVSPDGRKVAWAVSEDFGNFDVRRNDLWIADINGANPRLVATLYGGGLQAWLPDSARLLVGGKANRADKLSKLSIIAIADGKRTEILETERSRGLTLSPDGRFGILLQAQAENAAQNGLFLVDLRGGMTTPKALPFFGAFKWCDATRLVYVPLEPGAPSNALWQLNVETLATRQILASVEGGPFRISNGDWDMAADGRHIAFVSARDRNIWQLTLPAACGLTP